MPGIERIPQSKRFNELLRYAIANGTALTKSDFANKIGITNVTLSKILSGKYELSPKSLTKVNKNLNGILSEKWLFLGEGDMLAEQTDCTESIDNTKDFSFQYELRELIKTISNQQESIKSLIEQQSKLIDKLTSK